TSCCEDTERTGRCATRNERLVAVLRKLVAARAAGAERRRRQLRRGAAEEHQDRERVVLARRAGAARAEVGAEAAVERVAARGTELHPAELDQLRRRQVGRDRLHPGVGIE